MIYPRRNRVSIFASAAYFMLTLVCIAAPRAHAQSLDADAPTPLKNNVVVGRIDPRDIGDARPTSHFYTFDAGQGDLEIEVATADLEGDVDLFVANNLQPLTKFTLLAGATPTKINRTIFMRENTSLVLRVQGRTPGDASGSYRITLGGAFLPSTKTDIVTNEEAPADNSVGATGAGTGRRVNAVGGRIEDAPEVEIARAPSLPDRRLEDDSAVSSGSPAPATRRLPRRRATSPRARRASRPPRPPVTPPNPSVPAEIETAPTETGTESIEARTPPATRTPRTTRRRRPSPAPRRAVIPRLLIRTRDGAQVELLMSEVERVTIEGGELLVVLKNGQEQRLALTDVLRFTIEQ